MMHTLMFYITYSQMDDIVPRLCAGLADGPETKCLGELRAYRQDGQLGAFANFRAEHPFMSGILNSFQAIAK